MDVTDLDHLEHVCAWNNAGWLVASAAAFDDTVKVDPIYNDTCVTDPCYKAKAASVRDAADGSYMGWREYIPRDGSDMAGGNRRNSSRRRR